MDVPFASSGAMSRAHYSLVRKVESSVTTQQVDQLLRAEVESIRHRLAHPGLSTKQCKECLIILLYCSMSIAPGQLDDDDLYFAFPHAVNLAEAGRNVREKMIGYLFCSELMPQNHELQLMLVNTLRKDLESSSISRVCLALETLVTSATEDVIPAVQSRLLDLLSHNSYHIRRRALLAFRTISRYDPEILVRITPKLQKRLNDPHSTVVSAALITATALPDSKLVDIHVVANNLLRSTWSAPESKLKRTSLQRILRTLRAVKLDPENLSTVFQIVRSAMKSRVYALLLASFQLLSDTPLDALSSLRPSPVSHIRTLLTSGEPNEQYLFLSCLECLDPALWSGMTPEIPAVFEGWEVERIIQLLESPDGLIRKKTLRILRSIDPIIVQSYYAKSLQNRPPALSVREQNEYASRMLEILEIQCGEDGELYAQQVRDLLAVVDDVSFREGAPVLEKVVEMVLIHVRSTDSPFRIGCVTTLVTTTLEAEVPIGPSLMVVVAALATEYLARLSLSPATILRGFADKLSIYTAPVQNACLLSMLRIVPECDEVPSDVIDKVTGLAQFAPRYIRRRCDQFITLSSQKEVLADVVSRARSPTIPDFLDALSTPKSQASQLPSASNSPLPVSPLFLTSSLPHHSLSTSKLRYAAYEPPRPTSRLRGPPSPSLKRIDTSRSPSRASSKLSGSTSEGRDSLDALARTVTAGDLALAAGEYELEDIGKPIPRLDPFRQSSGEEIAMEQLSSRVDLIAFDSPFMSEPPSAISDTEPDFEAIWDSLTNFSARGWCEVSLDVVVRRLQKLGQRMQVISVDRHPFIGDLKILIFMEAENTHAALCLREGDDGSCLWRLRCGHDGLSSSIRQLLSE